MRALLIVGALSAAAFLWTGVAAQQEMLPKPGPGSGISRVEGTVSIDNVVAVRATQEGDWRVTVVPAPFLKPNTRYLVTWPDGSTERVVTLTEVGHGGWVMVDGAPRRWLNLGMARAVEEMR